MEKAVFRLESYRFTKVLLDLTTSSKSLVISFQPKGVFHSQNSRYELSFETIITCEDSDKEVVRVSCVASYIFTTKIAFGDIPNHFFPNSLAILFPYIRAFVSTLSLQANVQPILLPTINLSGLIDELREKTEVVD